MRVLGIDACTKGWVGLTLDETGQVGALAATRFAALVDQAADVSVVAVDMPVGLADHSARQADLLARDLLQRRRASVFITPIRAAVRAAGHAEASALNRSLTGAGVSRQAWNLTAKLLEVESWRLDSGREPWEVHPEVVFAELAGAPLAASKKTWAGQQQRRCLLARAGVRLPDDLGPAGAFAAPDDVLDAAAVAWTARRIASGQARSVPDPPELDHLGRPMAIWI